MIRTPLLSLAVLAVLAVSSSLAFAQAPPAPAAPAAAPAPQTAPVERRPPLGRPDMRGDMRGGDMRGGGGDFRGSSMMHGGSSSFQGRGGPGGGFHGPQDHGMMGDFHIAPPGMWWKSPAVVQRLTLTAEQTKKMDDIFQASRIQLIDLHANVEKQNVLLEPMLSANPPDTAKTLAQIDKVAQARADLEKANARMLLGIRGVLTPDQWTKLRAGGPGGFGRSGVDGGRGGPVAQ